MTVWQRQWRLSTAAIAVAVDSGSGGIEPMVPMAASSTVALVDGGSNNGVFTNTSHDNDCHPCPHCPHPCSGWRATKRAMARVARGMVTASRVTGAGDSDSGSNRDEAGR